MKKKTEKTKADLKVIPLGGLGEVGRNMTLLEHKGKILIVDMGFRFPGEDMPGIDYIIPNISYLKGKEKDIVGVVINHGHYDHIGAIPYIIDRIGNPPIYTSALARGIIIKRQLEFPNKPNLKINTVRDGDNIKLGPFAVEFFHVNHNIPDTFGLNIKTSSGNIVYLSDFKFDANPVNDKPTDFKKLKRIGREGVLLLMADSTGAEEEGHSLSEKTIEENLETIFKEAKGRIIAATFASLLNRVQQLIKLSEKYGRKVCVEGYSMKSNVEIAQELGYLKAKKKTFIKAKDVDNYPDSEISIICTGAQGEERAVLMRIANKEHKFLKLKKGDGVIFSSSVIPGNERTVQILKDEFYRQGAKVFHYQMMDIHAGGHAQQEELKELIKLMNPKFFIPIHGQVSMLFQHGEIAKETGIPQKNILLAENGQVIDISKKDLRVEERKVPNNYILVDGLGVGDVGEVVLRDRQILSEDGMFVIVAVVDRQTGQVRGSPDIISRGFVYLKESKDLLAQTRKKVISIVNRTAGSGGAVNWVYVKDEIKEKIGQFLFSKTQRRPIILPVVIEV